MQIIEAAEDLGVGLLSGCLCGSDDLSTFMVDSRLSPMVYGHAFTGNGEVAIWLTKAITHGETFPVYPRPFNHLSIVSLKGLALYFQHSG